MRYFLLALLLAAPLFAELKVGDEAPRFTVKGDVVNLPENVALADCQGDVVLIHEWERTDPSSKAMPEIQKLWEARGGKGFHVFAIHRLDHHKFWDIVELCDSKGWTFCIPMGGFYDASKFDGYQAEDKVFRTTVIGVDGKIAFYGSSGWQEVVDSELKKCLYPGLGKQTVAKPVEECAENFMKRAYGRALNQAAKLKDSADAAAKADAELVISRAEGFAKALQARIDAFKENKRFVQAMELLTRLGDEFKDHEIGKKADMDCKALKNDKALKPEIKAGEAYFKLLEEIKLKARPARIAALRAFGDRFKDTQASADALALAGRLELSMKK